MTKEQRNLFVDPSTASSSDDDGTQISDSGEEEDSSSDAEPIKSPVKISSTAVTNAASGKPTVVSAAKQSSDSDSGSETATESESEATDPPKSGSGKTVSSGKPSLQPTASSSDDDENQISESGEEEVSSSDEEPIKSPVKISSTDVTKAASGKPTVVSAAKQSSDSDSGSETATESEPEATDPPKSGSGKTVPSKKNLTMSVASLVAKSGTKRPASEGPPSKDNKKRAKVVARAEEESTKKPAFQRLWAEEDEVCLLQGMIEYPDSGKSPFEDKNGFYELLKKSISFEVSKNQFMEKIKGLRKKFMGKICKNGAEPKFANAHDQKTYNLCKHIWGPDGIAPKSTTKSVGVSKKSQRKKELASVKQDSVFVASPNDKKVAENDKDWFDNSFLVPSIATFGVDERFVKQKWRLVADEKKKKIEEKLKQLQAKEVECMLVKVALVHDVSLMVAEAWKNNP